MNLTPSLFTDRSQPLSPQSSRYSRLALGALALTSTVQGSPILSLKKEICGPQPFCAEASQRAGLCIDSNCEMTSQQNLKTCQSLEQQWFECVYSKKWLNSDEAPARRRLHFKPETDPSTTPPNSRETDPKPKRTTSLSSDQNNTSEKTSWMTVAGSILGKFGFCAACCFCLKKTDNWMTESTQRGRRETERRSARFFSEIS
jgi:hypothetical protein